MLEKNETIISKTTRIAPVKFASIPDLGLYEIQGKRATQEDAFVYKSCLSELTHLSPQQIGYRLWTTCQELDDRCCACSYISGSTASITVYAGNGNLIVTTVGDSESYLALLDKDGKVVDAMRLNKQIHHPTDENEAKRIQSAGGFILNGRIEHLSLSRSIGDSTVKAPIPGKALKRIPPDAHIDIYNIDEILTKYPDKEIEECLIISACDGYAEAATLTHEAYLKKHLEDYFNQAKPLSPLDLAQFLTDKAYKDGSGDNISVAVRRLPLANLKTIQPFFIGMFDGHAGTEAVDFIADQVLEIFHKLCNLEEDAYKENPYSVYKHREIFIRDNASIQPNVTKPNLVSEEGFYGSKKRKFDELSQQDENKIDTKPG